MLQCVVLQCDAVCCSELQCAAVCCAAVRCSVLQFVEKRSRVHMRVLQCVAVCCSVWRSVEGVCLHVCPLLGCNNGIGGFHETLVTVKNPKLPDF